MYRNTQKLNIAYIGSAENIDRSEFSRRNIRCFGTYR